jgi:hypothetical protein
MLAGIIERADRPFLNKGVDTDRSQLLLVADRPSRPAKRVKHSGSLSKWRASAWQHLLGQQMKSDSQAPADSNRSVTDSQPPRARQIKHLRRESVSFARKIPPLGKVPARGPEALDFRPHSRLLSERCGDGRHRPHPGHSISAKGCFHAPQENRAKIKSGYQSAQEADYARQAKDVQR